MCDQFRRAVGADNEDRSALLELLVLLSVGLQLVEIERASRGPYLRASGCRCVSECM